MLHAMQLGIFLAFVYDLLRIFRRVIPRGRGLVSAEDFMYWCFCARESFLLLHRESNGKLRWFAVFATVAGIWAYLKLGSPLFLRYGTLVLKKLLTAWTGLLRIIGKGVICHGRKIFKFKKPVCCKEQCAEEKKKSSLS